MAEQRNGRTTPSDDRAARLTEPIEAELARAAEWTLESGEEEERQLYWRLGTLHANRRVATSTHQLTVYRDVDKRRGAAVAFLNGDKEDRVRVADALTAADLALNPPYRLPEGLADYADVPLGERMLPEDEALRAWGERVHVQVSRANAAASHLEVFAGRSQTQLAASNGRRHAWDGAHLEIDLVLSAGEGDDAVELRLLRKARRLEDLLPDMVLDASLQAVRDRGRAKLPPTGRMPVILPSRELATMLRVIHMHTDGEYLVMGMLQKKVGDALIACAGDPVTIWTNPLRPHAEASAPTDASTVPARRISLLEGGVIQSFHSTPQYAAYMETEPTGPVGTLEWQPGTIAAADLAGGGAVLEVIAFSANMPDPVSGDFAAEIRMGYLHKDGERIPVAQGSVTGNIFEALGNCRISRETEEQSGYFGPRKVRFETLQVSGG